MEPLQAWNHVLGLFQKFRQGRNVGRNEGDRQHPGRSFWPEPDAIRNITGQSSNRHRTPYPGPVQRVFPRAEFGMPIITHFVGGGEPRDTQILPVVHGSVKNRMGSPLILKPLVLQTGKAVPCAILLATPPLEGVRLEGSRSSETFPVHSNNLQYEHSPLKGRSPQGSALEGFLNFLVENGYTEVPR